MTVVDVTNSGLMATLAFFVATHVLPEWMVVAAGLWILREIIFQPTVVEAMPIPEMATDVDANIKAAEPNNLRIAVVTGASGFLARHVINHLVDSGDFHEVRAVDIVRPVYADKRVNCITANICNAAAVLDFVRGADAVFHVASLIELRDHKYRRHRLFDVNVTGTMNVINACIRLGVRSLVYTSSTATVMDGRAPQGPWIEEAFSDVRVEDLPCYYAKTKKMAEDMVLKADKRGRLRTVALRPFVPFGSGDKLQTHRIVQESVFVQTHDGLNPIAFVYSKNAALWHYLAAKKLVEQPDGVSGEAYFISNGRDAVVTVKEQRDELLKRRKDPVKLTLCMTESVRSAIFLFNAVAEWCMAGRLNHHMFMCNLNAMPYTISVAPFDCSKGMERLGYQPLYTMQEAYDDIIRELNA